MKEYEANDHVCTWRPVQDGEYEAYRCAFCGDEISEAVLLARYKESQAISLVRDFYLANAYGRLPVSDSNYALIARAAEILK